MASLRFSVDAGVMDISDLGLQIAELLGRAIVQLVIDYKGRLLNIKYIMLCWVGANAGCGFAQIRIFLYIKLRTLKVKSALTCSPSNAIITP